MSVLLSLIFLFVFLSFFLSLSSLPLLFLSLYNALSPAYDFKALLFLFEYANDVLLRLLEDKTSFFAFAKYISGTKE